MSKTFGQVVRDLRIEKKKWTQSMLGQQVNLAQPAISLIENSVDEPPVAYAAAIAAALDSTVDEIRRIVRESPTEVTESSTGQDDEIYDEAEQLVFGDLLRRKREEAGLTVQQLSERSGISSNQINNLEQGISLNPQQKTINALQNVLGQFYSIEVEIATEDAASIPNLGQFEDFDPYDPNAYPEHPGIYVFYDRVNRPVYVGQSSSVADRVREHFKHKWFVKPVVQSAMWIHVEERGRRLEIESLLIKFLRNHALVNVKGVAPAPEFG